MLKLGLREACRVVNFCQDIHGQRFVSHFYMPTNFIFGDILESACRSVGLSAKSCPDNSSYSFKPIRLMLSEGAVDMQDTHL